MTCRVAGLAAAGTLLAGLAIVADPATPPAGACGGSTSIDNTGASVEGECNGNTPGRRPTGGGDGVSEADLFGYYCPGEYAGEARVVLTNLGPAPLEDVVEAGVDITGEYDQINVQCTGPDGGFISQYVVLSETTPPVDPAVLRDRALATIVLPETEVPGTIGFPNDEGDADQAAVVQQETWWWTTTPWTATSASDSQGFVTVTVTATPEHVTWNPGDGTAPQDCFGPGIPILPDASNYVRGDSYCFHIYERSSAAQPGLAFTAEASTRWVYTWSINGADQGEFGDAEQASSFLLGVMEIQGLNSNPNRSNP